MVIGGEVHLTHTHIYILGELPILEVVLQEVHGEDQLHAR